jgi:hypothetical protein
VAKFRSGNSWDFRDLASGEHPDRVVFLRITFVGIFGAVVVGIKFFGIV